MTILSAWLWLFAIAGPFIMTNPAPASDREIASRLDSIVQSLGVPDGPGGAVIFIKDGKAIYKGAVGYADVEHKTPITPATNFRLASCTKQFTAAAVLCLIDDGKLKLDTPLNDCFPGLPSYTHGILIRHLLTHTSGLPDYEDHLPAGITVPLKDADVLAILAGQSQLYFPPGTQYRYSNSAYALLSLIVEKYSGQRFPDFLHTRIFHPLGMNNTVAYEPGISAVSNRAYGYSPAAGGYTRTDQSLTSAVLGDGGVYSSVEDLAKWDAALYDSKILRPETQRLAFTTTILPDGHDIHYGFGWRVDSYRDHAFVGHGGDTIGFRTHIERYPADHFSVILLSNRNDIDPHAFLRRIVDAVLFDGR
ncbi:MAG TPA: serine hydrolase domain-containing protein [Tepidisphaeraceae bacterium]|nr:serine hydrolase domain-containing protein [Tepidisphaeraceae bacterium]